VQHNDVAHLDPEAWRDRLLASLVAREQDGLTYPAFPDGSVQQQFVGSQGEDALGEAYRFYDFVRMHGLAEPRAPGGYLDFGCGWGRITRFSPARLPSGADDGRRYRSGHDRLLPRGRPARSLPPDSQRRPLPFADGTVALATAYSVFTHLPPNLFEAWMDELLRVLAPAAS
jgi:hypothetical protein